MSWLKTLLNSVAWYWKILIMVVCSFLATLLPLPIPIADISFIAVIEHFSSFYWVIGNVMVITITDTIFAVITYLLAHKLSRVIIRNEKRRQQVENIRLKLNRQAPFWLFVAGVTPFPFTLTIYAGATIKYDLKKFTIIMFFSRLLKYAVIGVLFYFGYNLIRS